jgi:hypothetical protein
MLPFKRTTTASFCCLAVLFALAALLPVSSSEILADDKDDSWVPVTFLYLSDVKGLIEPCG